MNIPTGINFEQLVGDGLGELKLEDVWCATIDEATISERMIEVAEGVINNLDNNVVLMLILAEASWATTQTNPNAVGESPMGVIRRNLIDWMADRFLKVWYVDFKDEFD